MTTIASKIDHTLLKAEALTREIDAVVAEALEHGFASVCVNGAYVGHVAQLLRGNSAGVKACSVVGFPLGAMKATVKAIEGTAAAKDGAGVQSLFIETHPEPAKALSDAATMLNLNEACKVLDEAAILRKALA